MDSERIGIELGDLICATCDESIEEIDSIISTLGTMNIVCFEYIALLLWIATKEVSIVLRDKSYQHASNVAFSVAFDFLNRIEELRDDPEFNMNRFQDFIHNRFEQYYRAWEIGLTLENPTHGKVGITARREFSVASGFIFCCCFADEPDRLPPNQRDLATQAILRVLHHYQTFSKKVKSVLTRY